jgi:phage terminase large subunit
VLCAREYQNSIQESVHWLLTDQIGRLGYEADFLIQQQTIRGINGSEFIFKGLKNNPHALKSLEGIDVCWVEEAEKLSQQSWQILIPTIRKEGSEIWVSFNPDLETDPTSQMFIVNPMPMAQIVRIDWQDNPDFPQDLRKHMEYLAEVDVDAYNHVYGGEFRQHSEAQVLRGKWGIEYFEPQPEWDGPYHGSDLGFAQDPTTLMRCWIYERNLYVQELVYRIGLELDAMPDAFKPAGNYLIRMDNSRPETVSYLRRQGLNVTACAKGKGSVEDGIAFLRSFERIIIHPESRHTQEEARLYSYKVDRLSGDVLPVIVDAHNNTWDGVRYALEPVMKNNALFLEADWS